LLPLLWVCLLLRLLLKPLLHQRPLRQLQRPLLCSYSKTVNYKNTKKHHAKPAVEQKAQAAKKHHKKAAKPAVEQKASR
jgi:hypothetical protein